MTVDAGDEWAERWQVDMVVGVDVGLVGRAERRYILAQSRNASRLHQETIMAHRTALRRRRQHVDAEEE